jgi:hypothetical protein
MIINLICGDNIFTSNEKQWNKIRGIISSATYEFILDYKNNLILHDNDLIESLDNKIDCDELNYYQKTLYEKSVNKELVLKNIDKILKDISINNYCSHPKKHMLHTNNDLLNLYKNYLNLLTMLGISGIYSLLNIELENIGGFYSIGNSYDIANAIDLLLPFINNEYIEHLIFEVLMIFNHSVKNNLIISITRETDLIENKVYKLPLIKVIHKNSFLSQRLFTRCYKKKVKNNNQNFG